MKTSAIIFTILSVLFCCICCLGLIFASIGIGVLPVYQEFETFQLGFETPIPVEIQSNDTITDAETLNRLGNTVIPENDPRELAQRLGGITEDIPETIPGPTEPLTTGTIRSFWTSNAETSEHFKIDATLQHITTHTYFWVENGINFNLEDLQRLANDFENQIYPKVREFFGSEWSPGVDNDPHIYILYVSGIGRGIAGYYSAIDELHPLAHEYSNSHEMFFLSADNLSLGETHTYAVLAHEFQHMVHWNWDRNEETWINEGFSEVAALLTGYYDEGFDYYYAVNPDIPLTTWPDDSDTTPHYGGAFLFIAYILDRYGEIATQNLIQHAENGMDAVDLTLSESGIIDARREQIPTADDLFQDFAVTLYLQDASISDGRFAHLTYLDAPKFAPVETIHRCPTGQQARDVHQYGIDYIRITCPGSYVLSFNGSRSVKVIPVGSYSGKYAFWSNRSDDSDMTLTREFDFRDHNGPLTLQYMMWYDLEKDFDYVYLVASTDGENWEILKTPSGTDFNPTGSSYGWAYNGKSQGWIQESIDLSSFAGQNIWLRFEYVTDPATIKEGFLLDDVQIPEINYFSDFEIDNGGWQAEGFVRIQNTLPQTYRLTLLYFTQDGTRVEYLEAQNNAMDVQIEIGGDVEEVVFIVSGTSRYTNQRTGYQFSVGPGNE